MSEFTTCKIYIKNEEKILVFIIVSPKYSDPMMKDNSPNHSNFDDDAWE
jgi:hypothetical protein